MRRPARLRSPHHDAIEDSESLCPPSTVNHRENDDGVRSDAVENSIRANEQFAQCGVHELGDDLASLGELTQGVRSFEDLTSKCRRIRR